MSVFSEILQAEMKKKNYEQRKLAGDMDVAQGTITNYLKGTTVPSYDMLANIIVTLKSDPRTFFPKR